MRTKFAFFSALFLLFVGQAIFAQVTGTVQDSYGFPVADAEVTVRGGDATEYTNDEGAFTIDAKVGDVLIVTDMDGVSQDFKVTGTNMGTMNFGAEIVLTPGVIDSYRKITKDNSDMAQTTVSSATLENRPNASVIQTLQGQVSGLNIMTGSGQPGAISTVFLRGQSSLNGSSEPLYIVDGIPQNTGSFRTINPNDIETISVLKDASAIAIYGNRGANGVIVIKTRSGKYNQGVKFNYSATSGVSILQSNDYNMMDARTYLALEKQRNIGWGAGMTDAEIAAYDINTDWTDVMIRKGFSQEHNFSIEAGGENLNSFTSLGYLNQKGIVRNTDLTRYSVRNNLNGRTSNEKFKYTTNLYVGFSRRNEATSLGTGGVNQNPMIAAFTGIPYISPDMYTNSEELLSMYQANGTLLYTPLFILDKFKTYSNRYDELKLLGDVSGTLNIAEGLDLKGSVGLDYRTSTRYAFQSPTSFNTYLFLEDGQEFGGAESYSNQADFLANVLTQLNYNKTFSDKHTISAGVYLEYFKAHRRYNYLRQNGLYPNTAYPGGYGSGWIGHNAETEFYLPNINAFRQDGGIFSYFANADYDFDGRYGVSGTFRRDASSRFSADERWGTYWSVAGRWNIHNEKFLEGTAVNVLKLRASYGVTGNQLVADPVTGVYSQFDAQLLPYTSYDSYSGYNSGGSLGLAQLGNPYLKWEDIIQANIGLDYEFFKSRLRGSLDFYQKETEDMFMPVPYSAVYGVLDVTGNSGDAVNKGVEFSVDYDIIKNNNTKLTFNFNGAYNKNEITRLSEEDGSIYNGGAYINQVGGPMNEYFLYRYAGVNPENGNLWFYDRNGNMTEEPSDYDRYSTGKSRLPVYQGGFGLDFDYKGVFVTAAFTYAIDAYRMDWDYYGVLDPSNIGTFNVSNELLENYWISATETPNATMPSLDATNIGFGAQSDRFLVDASYLRLRYASLGYNLPKSLLKNTFVTDGKIFIQAENLVTWSKWKGYDAESDRAGDQWQYPTPRILSIGVNFGF